MGDFPGRPWYSGITERWREHAGCVPGVRPRRARHSRLDGSGRTAQPMTGARGAAPREITMGDKSPKSKQREKNQKTAAKDEVKRQSAQRQSSYSSAPTEPKQKKK